MCFYNYQIVEAISPKLFYFGNDFNYLNTLVKLTSKHTGAQVLFMGLSNDNLDTIFVSKT
jgi:hypothetical protein